jgi:hypothetical protein
MTENRRLAEVEAGIGASLPANAVVDHRAGAGCLIALGGEAGAVFQWSWPTT